MNDEPIFSDDDQAGMMLPDIEKMFGFNPLFTEELILKSAMYIPPQNPSIEKFSENIFWIKKDAKWISKD